MRIITGLIFLLNLTAWIVFDVVCWTYTGGTLGWIVLIGIITFLIAWGLSGEAVIAPFDYLAQPEWDIFVRKFKWSNNSCLIAMTFFAIVCIAMNWLQLRELLDIKIQ